MASPIERAGLTDRIISRVLIADYSMRACRACWGEIKTGQALYELSAIREYETFHKDCLDLHRSNNPIPEKINGERHYPHNCKLCQWAVIRD